MPNSASSKLRHLRKKKSTKRKSEFEQMQVSFSNRVSIVSEGDSWFAYPPNWFIAGPSSNLIDYISAWSRKKANFLTMASNGDEAVDMVSGKQKHQLADILRWHSKSKSRKPVDLLLFSGGGNDLVGENDFERFLRPAQQAFTTPKDFINLPRLKRKVQQIGLAYQELLDIRDHYSPDTIVITHTYDYPYPSLTGGVFLGGLITTDGWMKLYMKNAGIEERFQADIIKFFIDSMAIEILKIAKNREKFIVVESRGTLSDKKAWLNEIHPNPDGFKEIALLIFKEMKKQFPSL